MMLKALHCLRLPLLLYRGWRYKVLLAAGGKIDSARAVKRKWFRPKRLLVGRLTQPEQ